MRHLFFPAPEYCSFCHLPVLPILAFRVHSTHRKDRKSKQDAAGERSQVTKSFVLIAQSLILLLRCAFCTVMLYGEILFNFIFKSLNIRHISNQEESKVYPVFLLSIFLELFSNREITYHIFYFGFFFSLGESSAN